LTALLKWQTLIGSPTTFITDDLTTAGWLWLTNFVAPLPHVMVFDPVNPNIRTFYRIQLDRIRRALWSIKHR